MLETADEALKPPRSEGERDPRTDFLYARADKAVPKLNRELADGLVRKTHRRTYRSCSSCAAALRWGLYGAAAERMFVGSESRAEPPLVGIDFKARPAVGRRKWRGEGVIAKLAKEGLRNRLACDDDLDSGTRRSARGFALESGESAEPSMSHSAQRGVGLRKARESRSRRRARRDCVTDRRERRR